MSKDTISRKQAIESMHNLCERFSDPNYRCENPHIDVIVEELNRLPPAEPEVIYCKDCRKQNVSVGYQKDCCPLYQFRGMSFGHEHDYQYCCFAERKDNEICD